MGSKGANSLPEELMMEIMWRLPVKSLLRFKSVCKNWYVLIQNPNFINNHYNHPNNYTRLLLHHHLFKSIMLDPKSEVRYEICTSEFSFLSNETFFNTIPEDVVNPQTHSDDQLFNIIGPVNGLFFMYYDNQLALWNPATTEFRVVPLPHDFDFCYHSRFGFGLDPLTGDFKVVCIPYVGGGHGLGLLVQLYTLANDSWRPIHSVSASSLAHICTDVWHTRYLNGAYYWLSCTRPGPTVVKFDMGPEVFREIQTPPSFKSESSTSYNEEVGRLVLFNNSIALLENHYSNDDIIESIDVWVMKEDECWTKHSTVGLPPIPFFRPLGFWTNGELLFHENDRTGGHTPDSELVLYNPNNRKVQVLGNCTEVLNYKASLASVKGGSKFCQTSCGSTPNNKKRKRTALTEERY